METNLSLLAVFKREKLSITFVAQCLLWNLDKNFPFVDVFHCVVDVKAVKFT